MSKMFKLNTSRFSATRRCGGAKTVICILAQSEAGSMIEGIKFASRKKWM